MSNHAPFLRALAEATEQPLAHFGPDSVLDPWDSLAWIQAMSVIDECYGVQVNPGKLKECKTVGDVVRLLP